MKAIVILSGGLDSSTLLHYLVKKDGLTPSEVVAISFNYGQRHLKEIECAKFQCSELGIEHKIINLSDFMKDYKSALTQNSIDVPNIKDVLGDPQPVTYVPYRNQLFLTIACGVAESIGAEQVFFGAQMHDLYGYWDTTKEFVERINEVVSLNRKNPMVILAPFANFSKANVAKLAIQLNVDLSHTTSCYNGKEKACGTCPTCSERIKAFKEIGEKDGVEYG